MAVPTFRLVFHIGVTDAERAQLERYGLTRRQFRGVGPWDGDMLHNLLIRETTVESDEPARLLAVERRVFEELDEIRNWLLAAAKFDGAAVDQDIVLPTEAG